jgi:hypothetical protein
MSPAPKAAKSQHSEAVNLPGKAERTPSQIERDLQFFNDHKRQVWSDMQAGSDEFDRGLLTLSSGALALSLAFIKDVVPLGRAIHLPVLFASWVSFRRWYIDGDCGAIQERHEQENHRYFRAGK